MRVTSNGRNSVPILLTLIFLFKSSPAINFMEDSVTVTPEFFTSIKVENDSSHEILIDSIGIVTESTIKKDIYLSKNA